MWCFEVTVGRELHLQTSFIIFTKQHGINGCRNRVKSFTMPSNFFFFCFRIKSFDKTRRNSTNSLGLYHSKAPSKNTNDIFSGTD